jgi:transcriptional regulator with XRE-family HTH domain
MMFKPLTDTRVVGELPRAVGHRVRELRIKMGMSQEELAARADLHRNYVGSVERGERDIGITALGSLTAALGVSLKEFFAPFRQARR